MSESGARPVRTTRIVVQVVLFVAVYLLLVNARSEQLNPILPGSRMAVEMVVPVIAGLLFGSWMGLAVGLLGALAAAAVAAAWGLPEGALLLATPAGKQLLAALPLALSGLAAGWLRTLLPSPLPAGSLLLGHLLKIPIALFAGQLTLGIVTGRLYWLGVAWETLIGVAVITAATGIYRFGIERRPS